MRHGGDVLLSLPFQEMQSIRFASVPDNGSVWSVKEGDTQFAFPIYFVSECSKQ